MNLKSTIIQATAATALLISAVAVSFAQPGGPPPVNKCTCGINTSCPTTTMSGYTCACCWNGTGWVCKNCDDATTFDCDNPPTPYTRCNFDA